MSRFKSELTNDQWKLIKPCLPELKRGKGGPKPIDNRACFEGILWVLRSGARWKDLPSHYPSPSTCWRRLQFWEEQGAWLHAWRRFLELLDQQSLLNWEEVFSDGSFAPAKKGDSKSGKPSGARVQSGWWWSMAKVFHWEAPLLRPHQQK
ncbi:transposase [Microbulbifer sp. CnH-101-G]|uniref:transposase n=2 Tax=Microbulbifer sp. CnH-101-G TaxID=3243393 RepID=UPI004039E27B